MTTATSDRTAGARARADAASWAAALCAAPDTLYLDTETTGFGPHAEIVDIALVDGRGAVVLDAFVRPDNPIPPRSTRIHGITDDHVRRAPRWDVVYPRLAALLAGRTVVVYNAAFDLEMVNHMNRRFRYPPVPAGWQCAMLRYAAYAAEWNARRGDYRWHKLDAALAAFGHAPGGHRAAADAHACRLVVAGMAGMAARTQARLPAGAAPSPGLSPARGEGRD